MKHALHQGYATNEDFKQQRTYKKGNEGFEKGSKKSTIQQRRCKKLNQKENWYLENEWYHPICYLSHAVLHDSADNEDFKQPKTCKKQICKAAQVPITQQNGPKTIDTTSPNKVSKMSSRCPSTDDLPKSMCERCTSLLNQYEKWKDTADDLR